MILFGQMFHNLGFEFQKERGNEFFRLPSYQPEQPTPPPIKMEFKFRLLGPQNPLVYTGASFVCRTAPPDLRNQGWALPVNLCSLLQISYANREKSLNFHIRSNFQISLFPRFYHQIKHTFNYFCASPPICNKIYIQK